MSLVTGVSCRKVFNDLRHVWQPNCCTINCSIIWCAINQRVGVVGSYNLVMQLLLVQQAPRFTLKGFSSVDLWTVTRDVTFFLSSLMYFDKKYNCCLITNWRGLKQPLPLKSCPRRIKATHYNHHRQQSIIRVHLCNGLLVSCQEFPERVRSCLPWSSPLATWTCSHPSFPSTIQPWRWDTLLILMFK